MSLPDKTNNPGHCVTGVDEFVVSDLSDKGKGLLTIPVIPSHSLGAMGFEPSTFDADSIQLQYSDLSTISAGLEQLCVGDEQGSILVYHGDR